jgi:dienelactone hydrolase
VVTRQTNRKRLYEDANSAVKWLNQKGIKNENIILYGESLGTGIAVELSSKNDFGGVILESHILRWLIWEKSFIHFYL